MRIDLHLRKVVYSIVILGTCTDLFMYTTYEYMFVEINYYILFNEQFKFFSVNEQKKILYISTYSKKDVVSYVQEY